MWASFEFTFIKVLKGSSEKPKSLWRCTILMETLHWRASWKVPYWDLATMKSVATENWIMIRSFRTFRLTKFITNFHLQSHLQHVYFFVIFALLLQHFSGREFLGKSFAVLSQLEITRNKGRISNSLIFCLICSESELRIFEIAQSAFIAIWSCCQESFGKESEFD